MYFTFETAIKYCINLPTRDGGASKVWTRTTYMVLALHRRLHLSEVPLVSMLHMHRDNAYSISEVEGPARHASSGAKTQGECQLRREKSCNAACSRHGG